MKEYFLTLLGVVILSALIGTLSIENGSGRYIRLVCSLCVLCSLILPLGNAFREEEWDLSFLWEENEEDMDYDEIYQDALLKNETSYAEQALKTMICDKFSLSSEQVEVYLEIVSKNGMSVPEKVTMLLRGKGILSDPRALISWVNETVGCRCVIVYE